MPEMLKTQVVKIISETAKDTNYQMSRIEKFQVFCNVCDNMLAEGKISPAKHKHWTEIW